VTLRGGDLLLIADYLWANDKTKFGPDEVVVVERVRGSSIDRLADVRIVRTGHMCTNCSPSRFKPLPKET